MNSENEYKWDIPNTDTTFNHNTFGNLAKIPSKDLFIQSNNSRFKYPTNCVQVSRRPATTLVKKPCVDPMLVCITVTITIGSLCLLSGLLILCLASRLIKDRGSETILLIGISISCNIIGIGIFILSLAGLSWNLTTKREIRQFLIAVNEEALV